MTLPAARRAFKDEEATVVHFYGVTPSVVVEREELWGRIEPLLRSDPSVQPQASAAVWRFRDADGRKLLAIEESC